MSAENAATVDRSYRKLARRNAETNLAQNYLDGVYRVDHLTSELREALGPSVMRLFGRPVAQHLADVKTQRLLVDGFSGDDAEAAWEVWTRSGLSGMFASIAEQAVVLGQGYISVSRDSSGRPLLHVENARSVFVEVDEHTRERTAAVKFMREARDDGSERVHAYLYLPDGIGEVYIADRRTVLGGSTEELEWKLRDEFDHGFARVPIVPVLNNIDARTRCGRSDITPLVPAIDSLHTLLAGQLLSASFNAYPTRYATGFEVPKNPETGQPLPTQQMEAAQSRLWVAESEEAKFGTLEAGDLANFGSAIVDQVRLIASLASVPQHSFLIDLVNVSDAALTTSEASYLGSLVNKQAVMGRGIAAAVALALDLDDFSVEVAWRPVARYSPEVVGKAAESWAAVNVPFEMIFANLLGMNPREVAAASAQLRNAIGGGSS